MPRAKLAVAVLLLGWRAWSWRRHDESVLKRLLLLLPLVVLGFFFFQEISHVRTTIILLAEAPISEVRLSVDGRLAPRAIEHFEPSSIFVWHGLPTKIGSTIEMGWQRPGGERYTLQQVMPQNEALECAHIIRLGINGEPLPALDGDGSDERSPWRWLNSRCDRIYELTR